MFMISSTIVKGPNSDVIALEESLIHYNNVMRPSEL